MKMMHPCLLTGPFDWSETRAPRAEFDTRLVRARAAMQAHGVDCLIVHGNAFDHGALAWLTNFTPKLGPAFALVPIAGPMRVVFSGGPGMRPSAQMLTFVEDVAALSGVEKDIGKWLNGAPSTSGRVGLYEGRELTLASWTALRSLVPHDGELVLLDAEIDALRRGKSPAERHILSRAVDVLESTSRAFARVHRGLGRREAMLAAEAAAMSFGAQDARFRMSSRAFGPPAPADGDNARVGEPVCAAIAVRCGGYWAAGQTMFGDTPDSLRQRARAIMQSVLATARPGVAVDEVRAAAPDAAMTGHGLGLCLEEAPRFDAGEHFVDGDVVNLAVSLAIANDQSASWSTIVRVERGATRVLWAAPDLDMPAERN